MDKYTLKKMCGMILNKNEKKKKKHYYGTVGPISVYTSIY